MKSGINFYPLFNQNSPQIWQDFANIRADAVARWGTLPDPARYYNEYAAHEIRKTHGFSFVAYDGLKMVGFIEGEYNSRLAHIEGLYVLPEYWHQGVGRNLVYAAERATGLVSPRIDLISLPYAQPFYQRMGYRNVLHNTYDKNIRNASTCSIVPVFFCSAKIARACGQITANYNMKFDASVLHNPDNIMYVSVNYAGRITGFVIATADIPSGQYLVSQMCVDKSMPKTFYETCFSKYVSRAGQLLQMQIQSNTYANK